MFTLIFIVTLAGQEPYKVTRTFPDMAACQAVRGMLLEEMNSAKKTPVYTLTCTGPKPVVMS